MRTPAPGEPGGQGDGRVEVRAGDRPEQQDEDTQAEDGGEGVGEELYADIVRQLALPAWMPEPTTTVTSSPVPIASAVTRRPSDAFTR